MTFEEDVERYYGFVRSHLEEIDAWRRTIERFPPMAIRAAVREILERFDQHNIDPETLDWGTVFEGLRDYPSVDAFIEDLERKGLIPSDIEERVDEYAAEMERYISEMLEEIRQVDPGAITRIAQEIRMMLGEEDRLAEMEREIGRLREEVKRERRMKEEYSRKLEDYEEEVRKLRDEIEKLRDRVKTEAEMAEKLRATFTAYLRGAGVKEEDIRKELEKIDLDVRILADEIVRGEITQERATKVVEDFAKDAVRRLKPPVIEVAPPAPPVEVVPEVPPRPPRVPVAEPEAIAERILREYPAELLTFGVGWVLENYRGELGFADRVGAERVTFWLIKTLREFGEERMRRATRGVEYLAAMLLYDQADRIVRGGIREGLRYEWGKLRAILMRDYTEVLVKYGDKDLQLIIMGYAYKLLGAPYAGMPEDIRRALRHFEMVES